MTASLSTTMTYQLNYTIDIYNNRRYNDIRGICLLHVSCFDFAVRLIEIVRCFCVLVGPSISGSMSMNALYIVSAGYDTLSYVRCFDVNSKILNDVTKTKCVVTINETVM